MYTAEAVWRAQMEASSKMAKEMDGLKSDLAKKLEEVGACLCELQVAWLICGRGNWRRCEVQLPTEFYASALCFIRRRRRITSRASR